MLASIAALYLSTQSPKTFEALERAKVDDLVGLTNFKYTAEMTNVGLALNERVVLDESPTKVSFQSFDDKKEKSGDGTTSGGVNWIVTSQNRMALSMGGRLADIPHGMDVFLNPEQLLINFSTGQQVTFGSAPKFVLKDVSSTEEDGLTVRRAVAMANLKRGTATLTQWFYPGKWIVKRFALEIKGPTETYSCAGRIFNVNL